MHISLQKTSIVRLSGNWLASSTCLAFLLAGCGPGEGSPGTVQIPASGVVPTPTPTPIATPTPVPSPTPTPAPLSVSISDTAQIGDRLDRTGFKLSFEDEFNTLDRTRWRTFWYFGDPGGISSRRNLQPSLNEDDIVVDDAFDVGQGSVKINVRRNTNRADPKYDNAAFLTGALTTETSFKQKYGYFEARFTAPADAGLWPAFWLYDAPVTDTRALPAFGTPGASTTRNWRDVWAGGLDGEIDIVELLTNKLNSSWHTASARYRWATTEGGERVKLSIPSDTTEVTNAASATTPHTYGVLWTSKTVRFYRDDILVAQTPNRGLNAAMYMILSMGTGGWNANKPSAQFNSAAMTIEFARAYTIAGVN